MKDLFLRSGKWRWSVIDVGSLHGPRVELIDPSDPRNKLLCPAPADYENLTNDQVAELARTPELRLWTDDHGIPWRIARVGPDSHYQYPLARPHLVFDSEAAFAGIVEIDRHARLGDLLDDEIRLYRDRMRDFGGRRRGYRPPLLRSA